jgi:NADH dehydrogenase [ubiquinone] 1 alpha subcomplex assembly factor 6
LAEYQLRHFSPPLYLDATIGGSAAPWPGLSSAKAKSMTSTPTLTWCAEQVRRSDRDRFLTCLFADAAVREDLFALYAFNVEIARTRDVVSEPTLGAIRLQWWREAIEKIAEGSAPNGQHEVLEALAGTFTRHSLDVGDFFAVIDARAQDFEPAGFADQAALERYAGETAAPLFKLALNICGEQGEVASEAALAAALAWAQLGLIRAMPYDLHHRRVSVPQTALEAAGITATQLIEHPKTTELGPLLEMQTASIEKHMKKSRSLKRSIKRSARVALLPLTLADGYLATLRHNGSSPFDLRLSRPGGPAQLRLWMNALLGRY